MLSNVASTSATADEPMRSSTVCFSCNPITQHQHALLWLDRAMEADILQNNQFWVPCLASCRPMSKKVRLLVTFFSQVECSHPRGLLQQSNKAQRIFGSHLQSHLYEPCARTVKDAGNWRQRNKKVVHSRKECQHFWQNQKSAATENNNVNHSCTVVQFSSNTG